MNGTKKVTNVLLDDDACQDLTKVLNDRSGDKYFYFTQNINTGEIVDIIYNQKYLTMAQTRVRMLRNFDFDVSEDLTKFKSEPNDPSAVATERKRDITDESRNCWSRKVHDEANEREASGQYRVCITQFGVQRVEISSSYSMGSDAGFNINDIDINTTDYYNGLPSISSTAYSLVQSTSIASATPAEIKARYFRESEIQDYTKLKHGAKNLRKVSANWEGFDEEIFNEPDNVEDYIHSELQTIFSAPSNTQNFLALSKLIERYPAESSDILLDYLQTNPNGNLDVEKVIFGALVHSYSAKLEHLFLTMLHSEMTDSRKSIVLNAISVIRGDKISNRLVEEIHSRAKRAEGNDDTEGFAALSVLSIIAGQMHHAGKPERAEKLVDTIEQKLAESEASNHEVGILHSLHSLGNTHSRRSAPHLLRYLDPKVKRSEEGKEHFHKAAAQGLRGVPGSDITEALHRSLVMHMDKPEVFSTIKKSLEQRKRNAKHVERLVPGEDLKDPKWQFVRTFGDDWGNVSFFTKADWQFSLKSTQFTAITGITISLFDNKFDVMQGGAYIGNSGYLLFAAHTFFLFQIVNPYPKIPLLPDRITYVLFNWGVRYGTELPSNDNRDICLAEEPPKEGEEATPPPWKGIIELPTLPLYGRPFKLTKFITGWMYVTGKLFMQYNYEFNFKNKITTKLNEIQFRLTLDPGGEINAHLTARTTTAIVLKLDVNVLLLRMSLIFTYAFLLDGSGFCQALHMQANVLQGNVVGSASFPPACGLFPKWCSYSQEFYNWPGWSYYKDLSVTKCCDGKARSNSLPEPDNTNARSNARPRAPLGLLSNNGNFDYYEINGGKTRVKWANVNGAERPVQSISFIGNCTVARGCPDHQGTNPSETTVRIPLRSTGEYDTDFFHAGHILGAELGGSNTDIKNFFIQERHINSGLFRSGIEQQILNCLQTNDQYYALIFIEFFYSRYQYTPSSFRVIAAFVDQNKNLIQPVDPVTNLPPGCTRLPSGLTYGNANLEFVFDNEP